MNYGDIVTRAWRIVWNNKFLWVLGFFGAFTRASGNFSGGSNYSSSSPPSVEDFALPSNADAWGAIIIFVVCLFMLLGLGLWLVSLAARGGLITAVVHIENGEKTNLRRAFGEGFSRLGSLVGMNLLLILPVIFLTVLLVGGIVFTAVTTLGGTAFMSGSGEPALGAILGAVGVFMICFMFLMCIIAIAGVLIQFVNAFAFRGIMLKEMGAVESIRHGWQVFRENLAEAMILAILFFGVSFIYGLFVLMLTLPLIILMFAPLFGTLMSGGEPGWGSISFLVGGGVCVGLFASALYAILVSWQSAAFTLAYQEFVSKPGESFDHFTPIKPKEPEDIDDGRRPDWTVES